MNKLKTFWTEHKSEIISVAAVAGLYATVYFGAKAGTEKAMEDLKMNIALIPASKYTSQLI
jgi:hypothetical protein